MAQKNQVLAREDSRISLIFTRPTTTQEDYLAITEREMPTDTIEQTWIFEIGEETRVSRRIPKLANVLVKIMKWLNHLGSGKVDDSYLEARHNIHHDFRAKGIGL